MAVFKGYFTSIWTIYDAVAIILTLVAVMYVSSFDARATLYYPIF